MSAEEVAAAAEAQKITPTPESVTTQASQPSTKESSEVTSSTAFRTLDAFRKEAPEVYQKFMETIQQSILDDFKRRSKRVIESMKKMRKS